MILLAVVSFSFKAFLKLRFLDSPKFFLQDDGINNRALKSCDFVAISFNNPNLPIRIATPIEPNILLIGSAVGIDKQPCLFRNFVRQVVM